MITALENCQNFLWIHLVENHQANNFMVLNIFKWNYIY